MQRVRTLSAIALEPERLLSWVWWLAPYLGITAAMLFYLPRVHGADALQWYTADLDNLYDAASRVDGYGYVYSPAWAQLMQPLRLLLPASFVLLFLGIGLAALIWLTGPRIAFLLLAGHMPILWDELRNVNLNLLVGLVAWAGIRHPWMWALPLLTKVSPGVGLVWFLARREWRNLAIALGVTTAIAAVSLVSAPHLWSGWMSVLASNVGVADPLRIVPLWVRIPVAVGVVWWGARNDQPWAVPAKHRDRGYHSQRNGMAGHAWHGAVVA